VGVHDDMRAGPSRVNGPDEVDPARSRFVPLDRKTVIDSVAKTGRLVVVDEDYKSFGLTAEILASVVEDDPAHLKAAPQRLAVPDVPIPYSRPMEQFVLPNAETIAEAVRKVREAA